MSFFLLGFLVLVAVHFSVSLLLSLLTAVALPRCERSLRREPASRQAAGFFALALLPAAGGLLVALVGALPAWLRYEPRGVAERPGPVLIGLAAAGLVLAGLRLGGALRDQRRTSRLVARWIGGGRDLPGLPLRATRVASDFPLAAVFGMWRPRLLLSDRLLRGLDRQETRAVVEHEVAHAVVHENLRRFALRASPDPLALLPAGARLRSLFAEASEAAADERASARVSPLLLAKALLKTAALVPAGQRLDQGFAAFHREGGIAARVEALLRMSVSPAADPAGPRGHATAVGLVVALGAGLLFGGSQATIALNLHRALEILVHLFA